MKYVGMQAQISRNNRMSALLLLMFPLIILGTIWVFLALVNYLSNGYVDPNTGYTVNQLDADTVNYYFLSCLPWVLGGVALWFVIAYFGNTTMIKAATGARSLSRKENPRVYNIVENLTMACGMPMPKVNVIDDPQLNAFASGIDERSYTVTVTTGICDRLNDAELAGVIGHELTHIRNRDTRLLIVSIIFVGILSTAMTAEEVPWWPCWWPLCALPLATSLPCSRVLPSAASVNIWRMPVGQSCVATLWHWRPPFARLAAIRAWAMWTATMWPSFSLSIPRLCAAVSAI